MSLNDYFMSVVRTVVPTAVGAILGWLATLGLDLGATAETGLVGFLTALAIAVYYMVARAIEAKLPSLGSLLLGLGASKKPTYEPAEPQYVGDLRARGAA